MTPRSRLSSYMRASSGVQWQSVTIRSGIRYKNFFLAMLEPKIGQKYRKNLHRIFGNPIVAIDRAWSDKSDRIVWCSRESGSAWQNFVPEKQAQFWPGFFQILEQKQQFPPLNFSCFGRRKTSFGGGGHNFKTSASKYSSWDIDIIQAMPHPPFGAKDVC